MAKLFRFINIPVRRFASNFSSVTYSNPRNTKKLFGLGLLTATSAFAGFIYYNVIYLEKTVKFPVFALYNQRKFSKYQELINYNKVNLELFENLIDYYLLETVTKNEYIQDTLKVPIQIEHFHFKKNPFELTVDNNNIKLTSLEFKPPKRNDSWWIGIDKFNSYLEWPKVNPFASRIAVDPSLQFIGEDIDDDVRHIIIQGIVDVTQQEKPYSLEFKAYFDGQHRYQIKITSCTLISQEKHTKLW